MHSSIAHCRLIMTFSMDASQHVTGPYLERSSVCSNFGSNACTRTKGYPVSNFRAWQSTSAIKRMHSNQPVFSTFQIIIESSQSTMSLESDLDIMCVLVFFASDFVTANQCPASWSSSPAALTALSLFKSCQCVYSKQPTGTTS